MGFRFILHKLLTLILFVFLIVHGFSFFCLRTYSPVSLLPKIYILPPNAQILFYRLLTDGLYKRGLLPNQLVDAVNEYLPSPSGSSSTTIRPTSSSSSSLNNVEV